MGTCFAACGAAVSVVGETNDITLGSLASTAGSASSTGVKKVKIHLSTWDPEDAVPECHTSIDSCSSDGEVDVLFPWDFETGSPP